MTERTWWRWLLVAAAVTTGIGCALVVLALIGVPGVMMDVLYLPGEPDVAASVTVSFAVGVTGAVMAGWGASMLVVYLDPGMARRPAVAHAFLVGVLLWFALDCAVSLALGALVNVVGNVLFVALLVPPLAAISRGPSGAT